MRDCILYLHEQCAERVAVRLTKLTINSRIEDCVGVVRNLIRKANEFMTRLSRFVYCGNTDFGTGSLLKSVNFHDLFSSHFQFVN